MAEFVITTNPPMPTTYQIVCRGVESDVPYALVTFGDALAAQSIHDRLLPFKRMAICHPPLPQHLAFTILPKSLRQLLLDKNFPIKQVVKSLGLLGIKTFENNLKIDLDLDTISCSYMEEQFVLIKCRVDEDGDDDGDFSNWKNRIINLCEDINTTVGDGRMFVEYERFRQKLEESTTILEVLSIFQQSWIFWTTEKRMGVIYGLTGMINSKCEAFTQFLDKTTKIFGWREGMFQDKMIGPLVVEGTKKNPFQVRTDSSGYKNEEVVALLTFLRTCLGHFSSFQNKFTTEEDMIGYLDQEFSEIMGEVYETCTRMEENKYHNFRIFK